MGGFKMNRQYRKIVLVICLLCCLFLFSSLSLADGRFYPCYLVKSPITLDGKLRETVWQSLPEVGGFYILHRKEYAVYKQTFFRIGWDEKNIYIGIKCVDPDIEKIKITRKDRDSRICTEDSIEVFLSPKGSNSHFQFMINPAGNRWSAVQPGASHYSLRWWQGKSFKGKDFWSVEIKIPFSTLRQMPVNNEKWRFNICRNITKFDSGGNRYTTWSQLKGEEGFHDYDNFAVIQFKKHSLSRKEVLSLQVDLSADFIQFVRQYLKEALVNVHEGLSDVESDLPEVVGKIGAFRKTALKLQKILRSNKVTSSHLWNALIKARLLEKQVSDFNMQQLLQ